MATRRKRSRSGRSGTRAAGPPSSDALAWAERLASGEPAPEPSALEWAEGLGKAQNDGGSAPAAPSPWGTPADDAAPPAPPSPFGRGTAATPPDPEPPATPSPFGPATTPDPEPPATSPFGPATTASSSEPPAVPSPFGSPTKSGDDDGSGWPRVGESEPPPRSRSERRSSRGGSKQKGAKPGRKERGRPERKPHPRPAATTTKKGPDAADGSKARAGAAGSTVVVPLPAAGGSTDPVGPAAPGPFPAAGGTNEPAGAAGPAAPAGPVASRRSRSGASGKGPAKPPGRRPSAGQASGGRRPAGLTAGRMRHLLTKGLPRAADRPMVLIVAAVTAVVLGLGVGWSINYFGSGKNRSAATPQECAAAQTAWTMAANAQTGISEEDPASLRSGFVKARDAMASITPPDGIAQEWNDAQTFYATIADAVEKKKAGDAEGIVEAAAAASGKVDTNAMLETSKQITAYVNDNCNA